MNNIRAKLPATIYCAFCGEELELEVQERIEMKFICPECNKETDLSLMESTDSIIGIIATYRNKIDDPKVYFDYKIPPEIIKIAREQYVKLEITERPLVLIDTGIFGTAKTGAIITETKLYVKELLSKPLQIDLSDIKSANLLEFNRATEGNWLEINGEKLLNITMLDEATISRMEEMINDIIFYYQPELKQKTESIPEAKEDLVNKKNRLKDRLQGIGLLIFGIFLSITSIGMYFAQYKSYGELAQLLFFFFCLGFLFIGLWLVVNFTKALWADIKEVIHVRKK